MTNDLHSPDGLDQWDRVASELRACREETQTGAGLPLATAQSGSLTRRRDSTRAESAKQAVQLGGSVLRRRSEPRQNFSDELFKKADGMSGF